jgi:hypothetical protein
LLRPFTVFASFQAEGHDWFKQGKTSFINMSFISIYVHLGFIFNEKVSSTSNFNLHEPINVKVQQSFQALYWNLIMRQNMSHPPPPPLIDGTGPRA